MARSDTERSPGYLIKRVQLALRRACDAALKPTGLSMAQHVVLRSLADHPDASAAELARLCFVTRQALQDVLSSLRAAQLVESAPAPPRGRAQALRLTSTGSERLQRSTAAVASVESTMTRGISATTAKELSKLLTVCAENLESHVDRDT
jgi:DNA-binding MarR family transcriptional regulator